MNWGYKISIVFAGFVALIITLVVISMTQKDIHLVTEKYYEKEIAYQDQIDIEQNTADLIEKPVIKYQKENQLVVFQYPEQFNQEKITGKILFYRPSNANKDFTVNVSSDQHSMQQILVGHLEKGLWKVKMEWTSGSDKYYLEEKLVLK